MLFYFPPPTHTHTTKKKTQQPSDYSVQGLEDLQRIPRTSKDFLHSRDFQRIPNDFQRIYHFPKIFKDVERIPSLSGRVR